MNGHYRDTAYLPWAGEPWCNLWIPLASMSADQSVQVVRASHKGIQYDGTAFNPKDPTQPLWGEKGEFPRLPDISAESAENPGSWDIVGYDVVPGDVVCLHPRCLHRGGGTDSTLPERRNMVFRFFGDKAFFSDHLPKTYGIAVDSGGRVSVSQTDARNTANGRAGTEKDGLETNKTVLSAAGGYLSDGDPYRPADCIKAN